MTVRTAICLTALALCLMPAAAKPLEQFLWQNRPVVIFTPAADDPRMVEQRNRFILDIEDVKARDMVVVAIVSEDRAVSELGPQPTSGAAAFRDRFNVSPDCFAVILVGKDGTEKFRTFQPVPPRDLFALIDRMPMRQREIHERGSGGN